MTDDPGPVINLPQVTWAGLGLGLATIAVGLVLVAAVLAFAYFWPIYTGEVIPFEAWNNRMWNVTWR